jgi:hypothetical protein
VGLKLMVLVNPAFESFFTIDEIINYLGNAYGDKDTYVTRTNGFAFIKDTIFQNDIVKLIFGKGYGGIDKALAEQVHMYWFTYAFVFWGGGIVGTTLFGMFFVSIIVLSMPRLRTIEGKVTFLLAIILILLISYNNQLVSPLSSPLFFLTLASNRIGMNECAKNI